MTRPYFIYNLRSQTFNTQVIKALSPIGYLLAPGYFTRTTQELAKQVRAKQLRLLADNGNFSKIEKVRDKFSVKARQLWLKVAELEQSLGRSLLPTDKATSLRAAYRALANDVRDHTRQLNGNGETGLAQQLKMNPSALIGVEDITLASWLSLDIEPSYLQLPPETFKAINRDVAVRARQRRAQLPPALARVYYPVASAFSYNTAFDAGRVFANAGHEKIALGFGAFMADDNWSDHAEMGSRLISFPKRFPNRYLRTVLVAKGFWDGYARESGKAPKAFHFLGLGAPIMIPLVTLIAWKTPDLTFDATSPIKDALQGGTLYVSKPAYLKLRTQAIAFNLATNTIADWNCPCPFCRQFMKIYPFQRKLAFAWFKKNKHAHEVRAEDLKPSGALFAAFPLLSEPTSGPLRKAVDQARIGHNHWVLEEVTANLRKAKTRNELQKTVGQVIACYEKGTKSDSFGTAVRFAYDLACR